MRTLVKSNWPLILTHVGAIAPLAWLSWQYFNGFFWVNPIQDLTLRTGKAALVLLVLTLACTPVNTLLGWRPALKMRRWLGLYAFGYAAIHFAIFVGLDYGFNPQLLLEAIFEKRFALVGFAAGLLMLPLAITSTKGWQRRMGQRWKKLHRLVYLAASLAVIHYIWLVKADIRPPLTFGAIIGLLFLMRWKPVRQKLVRFRSWITQQFLAPRASSPNP
ncbi:MAG: protein-methionine-sulfoxide reductase heme-binding subunit MsrQ [Anaerolineales bacterium]|jgi:sulfoxide reductase heme-binding subunit YedZ